MTGRLKNVCDCPPYIAGTTYNQDWVEALEAESMLDVAEMVSHAALVRTESRGAHFREDYPRSERRWLRNIVLRLEGVQMHHRIDPLMVTHFDVEAAA